MSGKTWALIGNDDQGLRVRESYCEDGDVWVYGWDTQGRNVEILLTRQQARAMAEGIQDGLERTKALDSREDIDG